MPNYDQIDRLGEITTPLSEDTLVLSRFTGTEGMSRLFEFHAECVVDEETQLNFDKLLGETITVTVRTIDQGDRYFTGSCAEIRRLGSTDEGSTFLLVLRPRLWLFSKRVNSRSFQGMTATEIIKKMLDEAGYPHENKVGANHPKLEYCVQHNESDLNFLLRLMESEGISYHFKFGYLSQTLVLCDAESYEFVPGESRPLVPDTGGGSEETFFTWDPERRFTTNIGSMTDYNYYKSGGIYSGTANGDAKFDAKKEDYRHPLPLHPGKEITDSDVQRYAEVRMLSERRTDGHFRASGDCASLVPGHKVKVRNVDYLVLGCRHRIESQAYRSGGRATDSPYWGEFELMKADRYVPPIITPKPVVGGPQTGIVVDHVDPEGRARIKVRMHWDRNGEDTIWCRVAQSWASRTWGSIFIPRVDMEVIVDFLDGDPDRPIVIGCVYNTPNDPPYALPANVHWAGWKSDFEAGGGHNEIVTIDTRGEEKIWVHTSKDLLTEVDNDETRKVINERKTNIGTNDTHDVGKHLKITAKEKITLTVGESSITLEPGQITISSINIKIDAKAQLVTKGGATADHSATGLMTISGAMVKIN